MTVYILIVFVILLGGIILSLLFSYKKRNVITCFFVGSLLFILAALRSNSVGGDLGGYISMYYFIDTVSWKDLFEIRWEYGYLVLNKILTIFFGQQERVLLVVSSAIIVYGYIRYIYTYSKMSWLSLLLFVCLGYYTNSLSMLRQCIATAFLLNSIVFIERREKYKFILSVLFASFFHITAVAFLLLYPFSKLKISLQNYLLLLCLSFVFSLLLGQTFISYFIDDYFMEYNNIIVKGEGYGMLILICCITTLGLLLRKYAKVENKTMNIACSMMMLASCSQFLSIHFSLFARIVYYFNISMIVFLPNLLLHLPIKIRIIACSLICILAFVFFSMYLKGPASGTIPYRFM